MFALVTQADGRSRGQPWLALGLGLALVGAFAWSEQAEEAERRARGLQAREALVADWFERPTLALDPVLARHVGTEVEREAWLELWHEERRAQGVRLPSERSRDRAQERFDARWAEARALGRQTLAGRYALSSGDTRPEALFAHAAWSADWRELAVGAAFVLVVGAALEGAWGLLGFAVVALSGLAASGIAGSTLAPPGALPWVGPHGFCAFLLGAYAVLALRWPVALFGSLRLPVWALVPLWVGLEYLWLRDLGPDRLEWAPAAAHGALFAGGVAVAVGMRALGVEARLRQRDEEASERLSNPVLERAMAAHEAGKSEAAFALLQPELRKGPVSEDLVLAFWSVAVACERAAEAVPPMLAVVRKTLRAGKEPKALDHWKELAPALDAHAGVDPALAIRLGELLLDEGEPDLALHALGLAAEGRPRLPAALAIRLVRVARDLDPELTRRAATRGLADPGIEPAQQAELEPLCDDPEGGLRTPSTPAPPSVSGGVGAAIGDEDLPAPLSGTVAASPGERASPASRDVLDEVLGGDDVGLDGLGDEALAEAVAAVTSEDPDGAEDDRQDFVSPDQIEDLSGGLPVPEPTARPTPPAEAPAADPLDYGSVDLTEADPAEPAGAAEPDRSAFDDPMSYGAVDLGAVSSEASTEAPEEITAPTAAALPAPTPPPPEPGPAPAPAVPAAAEDPALADTAPDAGSLPGEGDGLRPLQLLQGVPLEVDESAIKLEVDGRGKARVAFEKIDALAVAAVRGLGARPVLVIDLVLNWVSVSDEPLRVIRLRSDRFDPRKVQAGPGGALEAMRALLATLLESSAATPLPDAQAARGTPFRSFPSLGAYQREILKVD